MGPLAGPDDELRLPEDDVPRLDVPGGHQDPAHSLPLLHLVWVAAILTCGTHFPLIQSRSVDVRIFLVEQVNQSNLIFFAGVYLTSPSPVDLWGDISTRKASMVR